MVMNIKIKENSEGHINIDMQWKSAYAFEHEVINIESYAIGRKAETITKAICDKLNLKKSERRLRF